MKKSQQTHQKTSIPRKRLTSLSLLLAILILLSLLSLPLTLAGCSTTDETPRSLKIGVLTYRSDDTFINALTTKLTASLRLRENTLGKKLSVNIASSNGDQNEQNTQIDRFLKQNYDVLIVNLVDRTTASVVIQKCKRADVPVIFFNREPVAEDMASWEKLYYVGTPIEEPGALQGEILLAKATQDFPSLDRNGDGQIQYVMLEGETNHQDALLRTESSIKVMTKAGYTMDKLANDSANWDLAKAYSITSLWLEQFGSSIEVVIANNDDMALGAIRAYQESPYAQNHTLFLGFDGTPVGLEAVQNGSLHGTVINDTVDQAAAISQLAVSLAQDQPINEGQYVRIPHRMVTITNIAQEIERAKVVK